MGILLLSFCYLIFQVDSIPRFRNRSGNYNLVHRDDATKTTTKTVKDNYDVLQQQVLDEIKKNEDIEPVIPMAFPLKDEISLDFSSSSTISEDNNHKSEIAYRFLRGLASSSIFINKCWHQRPLLIRSQQTWVKGCFVMDPHLKLLDGSYITGYKTADILRNGTKTDTWQYVPLKEEPSEPTTWKQVKDAIQGGTIYFNTAGSLWPNLGALCRITTAAFGFPTNINVYITPHGTEVSVPPHTDKQDVFVFQTQGSKRWRVYKPPPRYQCPSKDPFNRGKGGDVLVLSEDLLLLDTIIHPGDILYVPVGFPHTTDTAAVTTTSSNNQDISIHLTVGLDTHVWGLTLAHIRWSLLQRCGKTFRLDIQDDDIYWKSMESLPIGFLGGKAWIDYCKGESSDTFQKQLLRKVKDLMLLLEPNRFSSSKITAAKGEIMPSDESIVKVMDYFLKQHYQKLLEAQDEMFRNIRPKDPETLIKAYHGSKKQEKAMENLGIFSHSDSMKSMFEQRRRAQEERLKLSTATM
mmetsp:Transcript_10056/g.11483  ORF Transcript_10056/g.11483 Transcript_10056/m.11483 type:complete len:520 (+) Transcript_10056:241-1800(+)